MCRPMVEEASVKIFSTVFSVALPFHHNPDGIRIVFKCRHFFKVCYGAQAVGTSASLKILQMRRRYSALLS